jgi:hypothetical protein
MRRRMSRPPDEEYLAAIEEEIPEISLRTIGGMLKPHFVLEDKDSFKGNGVIQSRICRRS